ncbi:MAG: hypothetical protein PHG66_01915 [Candidatus Colwellbacteria bacterium]|nr:hypothetical protein [Candidatus Colwellbacteria bacterium]
MSSSLAKFNSWKETRETEKYFIRQVMWNYWDKYNGVFSMEKISKFILADYGTKVNGTYSGY